MPKKAGRKDKEERILIGLVDYYIKTKKPVGSSVLQENGFQDLSSATIRNYFAVLEEEGFVAQLHSSGGRIPTSKGFQLYASKCLDEVMKESLQKTSAWKLSSPTGFQDIIPLLQQTAAQISDQLRMGVLLSSPRFDRDSIIDIHFHFIDVRRILAIVVSEFGLIHTQIFMSLEPLSPALVRKAERFAKARIYNETLEDGLFEPNELQLIRKLYQEAVSSFFVRYSSFSQEDVFKCGFARLLEYPEFEETERLRASLALFENTNLFRGFFREVQRQGMLRFWIGEELVPYVSKEPNCVCIAVPYRVGDVCIGSIGVVGPERIPYKEVFRQLRLSACMLSSAVTELLMKNRITYRMPDQPHMVGEYENRLAVEFFAPKLLEVRK